MNIQIDGTNNVNKGAELMFCAICKEIGTVSPGSIVYIPHIDMYSPYPYKDITIKYRSNRNIIRFLSRFHVSSILRRMHLPFRFISASEQVDKNVDVVFNAGGYSVGDIWNHSDKSITKLHDYFVTLKKNKTKIIYLPQQFGPFTKSASQATARLILEYADMVYAREQTSYNYLASLEMPMDKVKIAPDFTPAISGILTDRCKMYENSIIIIPNNRMLTETGVTIEDYARLINLCKEKVHGRNLSIILLNHEGVTDLKVCNLINDRLEYKLPILSGLETLETKGLLASAYAVVSSRFHGTSSCLAAGVPCLSSSWSPKYELLYADYKLENMIINLKDFSSMQSKIEYLLSEEGNNQIRNNIEKGKVEILKKINSMWEEIFNIL